MSQRRPAVETIVGRRRSRRTPPRRWPSSLPGPARGSSAMGRPLPNPTGPGLQRPSRQARRARRTALFDAQTRCQGHLPRLTSTKRENRIAHEAPRKLRIRCSSGSGSEVSTYPRHPVWAERSMAVDLQSAANRLAWVSQERKNQPNQRPIMLSVERPARRE